MFRIAKNAALLRSLAGFCAFLLLAFSHIREAQAGSSTELRYTQSQIFSGALRYLRIDLGYEITEKDPEAAYLLFTYTPQGRKDPTFGAVEIVATQQAVRLIIKLPQLPSYQEAMIRDGLIRKLREEYGAEPPRPAPPKEDKPAKPTEPEPGDDSKPPRSKDEPAPNNDAD